MIKKSLLCLMMVLSLRFFASIEFNEEQHQHMMQSLTVQRESKKNEFQQIDQEICEIDKRITEELARKEQFHKNIAEQRLEEQEVNDKNSPHAQYIAMLKRDLAVAGDMLIKIKHVERNREDEYIEELFSHPARFHWCTAKMNLVTKTLHNALDGVDSQIQDVSCLQSMWIGCKTLACCWVCYPDYSFYPNKGCCRKDGKPLDCCGYYEDRTQAISNFNNAEALVSKKLEELRQDACQHLIMDRE